MNQTNSRYDNLYEHLGITAEHIAKRKIMIASPLKAQVAGVVESTPSFSIDLDKALFYDFSVYAGQTLKGGTFEMLAGALGISTFQPTSDTENAIKYAESIINKNLHTEEIEGMILRNKPEWNVKYVMESPMIGYDPELSSLIFHYLDISTHGQHSIARLSKKYQQYSFRILEDGKRERRIHSSEDNTTHIFALESDDTARSSFNVISTFNYASNKKTLYLVEGESDAITLSTVVEANSIIASFKNVTIPFFPSVEKIVVIADVGAENLAEIVATRAASIHNTIAYLVTFPEDLAFNKDISDILRECTEEDRIIRFMEIVEKARPILPLPPDLQKAFFFPLGSNRAVVRYRDSLCATLNSFARSNTLAFQELYGTDFELKGVGDTSFILSTADILKGTLRGRRVMLNINVFHSPCYEMTPLLCKDCTIYDIRKALSKNESGLEDDAKWVGTETNRALELPLGIFPGNTLNEAGSLSTSSELRRAYQRLFNMNCGQQSRPVPHPRFQLTLTMESGVAVEIVFIFEENHEEVEKYLGKNVTILGYWHGKVFYATKVSVESTNEIEISYAISNVGELLSFVHKTIDQIDASIGEVERTPRHFVIHFLAAMLSGYKLGAKYMGSHVIFLGDPNIGKSHYVKGMQALLDLGGLLSWSTIKKSDFKFSAMTSLSNVAASAPPIVTNNGYFLGIDDYQGKANDIKFDSFDGWSVDGTIKPSGVMARTVYGDNDVDARTPLILLGNLKTNAQTTDGILAMQKFAANLQAADAKAVSKRFGMVIVKANEKTLTTKGTPTASPAEISATTSRLLGMFFRKNSRPYVVHDNHLQEVAEFVKHDEGDMRRALSFVNLVRLIVDAEESSDVIVKTALELLKMYPFTSVSFDKNLANSKYYWGEYGVNGTPFARSLEQYSAGKLSSIFMKHVAFNRNMYMISVGEIWKALDPNLESRSAQEFFGIEKDDAAHDESIVMIGKKYMQPLKGYLREIHGVEIE